MARKYYHADDCDVVRDNHDGITPGIKLIARCPTIELAAKTAAKLNAADDFEYALAMIAEGTTKAASYARAAIHAAGKKSPNHY